MSEEYDVVIAGSGPAGSTAAYLLSAQGYDTAVLESDSFIGETRQSTGGTFPSAMGGFGIPPEAIMNKTDEVVLEGPENEHRADFPGCVLDFADYKQEWAERAMGEGAEYLLNRRVTGTSRDSWGEGEGESLTVLANNTLSGESEEYEGSIVIDATGANATIGRYLDMVDVESERVGLGVEYEMRGTELDNPDAMVLRVDYGVAPGGYAWIFGTGENTAKVGVCGYNGFKGHHEEESRTWEEFFDLFVEEDYRLQNAEKIPNKEDDGGKFERHSGKAFIKDVNPMVDDNLILAGDTVASIDPVWGEGIENCMKSGRAAAQAATYALESGDLSADSLGRYETLWNDEMENREGRLRLANMMYSLDDETFDDALEALNELEEGSIRRLQRDGDLRVVAEMLREKPSLAFNAAKDVWKARNIW